MLRIASMQSSLCTVLIVGFTRQPLSCGFKSPPARIGVEPPRVPGDGVIVPRGGRAANRIRATARLALVHSRWSFACSLSEQASTRWLHEAAGPPTESELPPEVSVAWWTSTRIVYNPDWSTIFPFLLLYPDYLTAGSGKANMWWTILAAVTLAVTLGTFLQITIGNRQIGKLKDQDPAEIEHWPSISVIVAARDEQANIEPALDVATAARLRSL